MTGRQRVKKNGRLSQQKHGDCFLHVPSSWLNYWPVSRGSENLMLVKVTLSDKRHFLTSVSPKALSPKPTGSGYKSPPRDLEIDPNFAKELGISTAYKAEVLVESVDCVERCTCLCLEPLNPEDLDKLESNQGKIEYELMNRIRVVSGHSFSFPIWIDQDVVPVRVVSSEPAATWVLLGSELTGVRGEAATAIIFKRQNEHSPAASSSSDSYQSPFTPRIVTTSNSTPYWANHGLSDVEETSPEDGETASISSSTGSRLFEFFRPIFSAINSQGSIQANTGSERFGTRTPEPATVSAPSTSAPKRSLMHRKSKSCSQISDSGSPSHRLPKYVETPEMNALLRVQPHAIRGPGEISTGGGHDRKNSEPHWEYSRVFDVYVNPSTFPEISNHWYCSGNLGSFLVQLRRSKVPASSRQSSLQASADQSKGESSERITTTTSDTPPSLTESDNVTSPVSDTGFELSRIMSVVASSLQDTHSDTSDGSASVKSDKPLTLVLPDSLVVHLCFTTKLVCSSDGRVHPFPHKLPEKAFSEYREVLSVAPGHIVMSDVVRRQLKIGSCSLVRVSEAREEGRLPAGSRSVTVHLRPLNEQSSIMKTHRETVEEAVREWICDVASHNPFGPVLVQNQIIPFINSTTGVTEYCSVEVAGGNRPSSSSATPKTSSLQPLVQYVMLSPQEMTHTHRPWRVRFVVEKTRWTSGAVASLPSLSAFDPPSLTLNPSHFGAFEKLINRGREYLQSALLHRAGHEPAGRLLIAGSTGDAGLACGKTSLARLIVQDLISHPTHAHVQLIDCTTLRGQTAARIGKRLKDAFELAIDRQPSVVLLDDLHNAMPHFSDGEDQTSAEAILSTRNTHALLDQLSLLNQSSVRVAVVAVTRCRQDLHPMLVDCRGAHIFEETLQIQPPDLAERESILRAILECRAVQYDGDISHIARQTEGYQTGDLVGLVDRAVSSSHIRHACPDAVSSRFALSVTRKRGSRVSFTLDDLEMIQGEGGSSGFGSPLLTRSLPSSPLKERRRLKLTKSFSPTTARLMSLENFSVSTTTLTGKAESLLETNADGRRRLIARDFRNALAGFVPLALQGLSLHSAGMVDFSHVGGMTETKRILRETILWPSMYPKLFSQCPIRMCRGILLYGPPGTGKTLLAGSIAKQFGLNFVSIKGPEILSKYIGASEQAVRDLFIRAQAAKPCVLFFDEFDSLAPKRGQDRTGVTDRVVNQLLTQMDGVESLEGVYIVAATSRPDMIDPALLRPGRIDKSILCDHPNEGERADILKALTRTMHLDSSANLRLIAQKTPHYTGADLKAVLYSAHLRAAHRALDREKGEKRDVSAGPDEKAEGERSVNSSRGGVRVYRMSGHSHTGSSPDPELQQRAIMLQELSRDQRNTLKWNINLASRNEKKQSLCITQEDLVVALDDIKPSVSPEERQRLTDIYDRFTGKVQQTLKAVINQRATMA